MSETRTPATRFGVAASLAILALLTGVRGAVAQTVSLADGKVEVFDTDGDSAALLDNGANYAAGGNGRTATLSLRSSDGPITLFYHAFQAQLVLGGGTHEGIVLIKDDDGFTTTIDLDGRTGAIRLGGTGEDGDLILYDSSDTETFRADGASGSATNQLGGNGLVKAWARVNSDGTVLSCWRCDAGQTIWLGPGRYRVDFSPLGSDIRSRPRTAILDNHAVGEQWPGFAHLSDSAVSNAAVLVSLTDDDGAHTNAAFTVFVY